MDKGLHIVFNAYNSGLGNNGGSKTIIKCSETLNNLGVTSQILAMVDNFSWFGHSQTTNWLHHNANVLINTACGDLSSTMALPVDKKYWYIRGHETWSMPESNLINWYKEKKVKNIVNSKGLQNFLESFGADSEVIYQGLDLDLWYDTHIRSKTGKIKIGCLHNLSKDTKRWTDFIMLSKILGMDNYEYMAFGTESCNDTFISKYLKSPTQKELLKFYNECHVFFLPTISEGLHNVGMEAGLCGCLLVGNNNVNNGMVQDYLFDNHTAMVYNNLDIEHAAFLVKNSKFELVENTKKYLKNNIGSREFNMKKLINLIGRY